MRISRPLLVTSAALLLLLPFQADAFTIGKLDIPIFDNDPVGVESTVQFPFVQQDVLGGVEISVEIDNSDISGLRIELTDPNLDTYVLYTGTDSGSLLIETYDAQSSLPSGDLSTWIGQEPTGDWTLIVIDSLPFMDAVKGIDGEVVEWTVTGLPVPEPSSSVSSLVALITLGAYRSRVVARMRPTRA